MEIYGKDSDRASFSLAINEFFRARREAVIKDFIYKFIGADTDLIAFEDIRKRLNAIERPNTTLEDIPINSIVGSVNRYEDFSRTFLPRTLEDRDRWARVLTTVQSPTGAPPIDVYQIGEIYFVLDGNHRVSVARRLNWKYIQAYVTKIESNVPLSPDDSADEIILKTEKAQFLEKTGLEELRPQVQFNLTAPGRYVNILQQIEAVHAKLYLEVDKEISYQDAVLSWCDEIYMPVAEIIRDREILKEFPGRTEADLFLWIVAYRLELAQELGWDLDMDAVAAKLADRFSPTGKRVRQRITRRVKNAILPEWMDTGPPTGAWRQEHFAFPSGRLFSSILVYINGSASGWSALDAALKFAHKEDAVIFGLHTIPKQVNPTISNQDDLQEKFSERLAQAGIQGKLAIDSGDPTLTIIQRGKWADLIVAPQILMPKQKEEMHDALRIPSLIQRLPTPILLVSQPASHLERMLLIYDGGSRAREALFLAAYLTIFWDLQFSVIPPTPTEPGKPNFSAEAQSFLETYGIAANYIPLPHTKDPRELLSHVEQTNPFDFLVISSPTDNKISRELFSYQTKQALPLTQKPILICR